MTAVFCCYYFVRCDWKEEKQVRLLEKRGRRGEGKERGNKRKRCGAKLAFCILHSILSQY
jgi:hypothetical protein